jgi:periplasmic divalent cation tolerance protein
MESELIEVRFRLTPPDPGHNRYPFGADSMDSLRLPANAPLRYVAGMPTETLVVLCTLPDRSHAYRIAHTLIEEQLAACVNIIPGVSSVYRWRDKVHQDEEILLLIKTAQPVFDRLEQRIRALHPYELPEIIAVPVRTGQAEYLQWINDSLRITP